MNRTTLLFSAVALIFSNNGAAIAQQKTKMGAIGASEAMQKFRDICVTHYLDKEALLAKLQADSVRWVLYEKRRPSDITGGLYLESKRGEIGYISLPNQRPALNDPACHFSFVSDRNTTHQSLVTLATKELGLYGGRDTTSKTGLQMRWDYQNIDGTLVRIFVSSGVKANGRVVSRLSISRHRTLPPKPAGQII